jgi:NAD(P)-dependent dehydrogenase (short-subunit alcohol dehydrogenase family)
VNRKPEYNLAERTVIITGAAGGIGAATARELVARGALVTLVDLSHDAVTALAKSLPTGRALAHAADVTSLEQMTEAIHATKQHFGKVDVVFANAGIANDPPTTLAAADLDAYERVINVDLHGVIRTIKPALPEIIANQGHVLITASVYAFVNGVANSAYAASKAAVEMLGRSLRLELAPHGASAGVLYPGWVATPIANAARGHNATATALTQHAFRGPLEIHRTRGNRHSSRRRHPNPRRQDHPTTHLATDLSAARHRRRRHRRRDASRPHDPPPQKPARTRSHNAPIPLETACAHGRATLPRSGQSRSTSSTHPTSLFARSVHLSGWSTSVAVTAV